ncbi:MAG TPA: flagellar motor protein MotB [Solirubrobacteraceae bacterium]|nr:flagellar motor protein MotB [Solirubrobacteraceae bacterium]
MSRGRRSRRRRGGHEEGNNERWLLTYADMITLLMALFMVLFSISSVNISKFKTLQLALKAAFSGNILPGGKAIAQPGATANSSHAPSSADVQAIAQLTVQGSPELQSSSNSQSSPNSETTIQRAARAAKEQSTFKQLKRRLDAYSATHGFGSQVQTSVQQRGLVIRVLTDRLLFPSGSANLIAQADPLLEEISALLNVDRAPPIAVEGNTDNVPISGGAFPSNWELSTARASTVVRFLIATGVSPQRLSASGYANLRPIAPNTTPEGRARNRRVEIVLQRLLPSATNVTP